jgi:hypothetical protein
MNQFAAGLAGGLTPNAVTLATFRMPGFGWNSRGNWASPLHSWRWS